ncbi:helix-turn-helix domain-containing protein [Actinoallomurus soli]|uniref:helix-turn-helix domain-containing protein n=1 Tax=Actinoallomurus soli TaxID=2952535 RepID=UPI002092A945|nr:helix-turn-helix transcriptional regulator [Actinoallomurus soli]MCO5970897.1 helix-turn-helix transcriptional regulator [Actinoallomurus soli]
MTAAENLDPDESLWNAIAFHLRYERQKRGMSQTEVGNIIGVNKHGVSNAEAGRNKVTSAQAARLDKAWDTGGLFLRLRRFARLSHNPDWPARVDRYQRDSDQLKIFYNSFVPLPFQTEDYARGLLSAGHSAGLIDDLEAALLRRMAHQAAILERRPQPPLIWAVLDEAALRPMGGPAVMKAQFEHLIHCSRLPHVSLRIVPLTAAPHIGIDGWFWFFELPGRRLAAFAGTTLDVGRVIDDPAEAVSVAIRFDRLAAQALNEDQTRDLLLRMAEDL